MLGEKIVVYFNKYIWTNENVKHHVNRSIILTKKLFGYILHSSEHALQRIYIFFSMFEGTVRVTARVFLSHHISNMYSVSNSLNYCYTFVTICK